MTFVRIFVYVLLALVFSIGFIIFYASGHTDAELALGCRNAHSCRKCGGSSTGDWLAGAEYEKPGER